MVTYMSSSSTHKSYLAILSKSYMSSSVLCKSLALLSSSSEEAVLLKSPKFSGDDVLEGTLFCGDPNDTLFFVFNSLEASLKDEVIFLFECD